MEQSKPRSFLDWMAIWMREWKEENRRATEPAVANSKSEYKRMKAQGANVELRQDLKQPAPASPPAGDAELDQDLQTLHEMRHPGGKGNVKDHHSKLSPYDLSGMHHAAPYTTDAITILKRRFSVPDQDEYAWLVERNEKGTIQYAYIGTDGKWGWTPDSVAALHLSREFDAERVWKIVGHPATTDCTMPEVREHAWPNV